MKQIFQVGDRVRVRRMKDLQCAYNTKSDMFDCMHRCAGVSGIINAVNFCPNNNARYDQAYLRSDEDRAYPMYQLDSIGGIAFFNEDLELIPKNAT